VHSDICQTQADQKPRAQITLAAKDVETLDEFQTTIPFEKEYLHKLEKWIAKRRFQIDRLATTD